MPDGRATVANPPPAFDLPESALISAATDDVVAVYQALLQDYEAHNIGIYGASSGAHLAAQTLVWLQQNQLPRPGLPKAQPPWPATPWPLLAPC